MYSRTMCWFVFFGKLSPRKETRNVCAASPRGNKADRRAKTITETFPCTATVNEARNAIAKENGSAASFSLNLNR